MYVNLVEEEGRCELRNKLASCYNSRGNEMLLKAAREFSGQVRGNVRVLLKNGLDEKLWETSKKVSKDAGGQP